MTTRIKLTELRTPGASSRRGGFTMIEMIIVITVIGILMALATGAYLAAINSSNQKATQALITQLNGALKDRLESFYGRNQDGDVTPQIWHFQIADPTAPNYGAGTYAKPPQGTGEYQRAAVVARLELMRGEFPQEFADFLRAAAIDPNTGTTPATPPTPASDASGLAPYFASTSSKNAGSARSAIFQRYRALTQQTNLTLPVTNAPTGHTWETESSECLYLLLTAVGSEEGMKFSVDQVPARFIQDTDGDGLMEFVDSWGTPLRFYRWPTDYLAYLIDVQQTFSRSGGGNMDPKRRLTDDYWFASAGVNKRRYLFEQNGYYRLHPAYPAPVAPSTIPDTSDTGMAASGELTARQNQVSLYPVLPMIISAGPDKAFGLYSPTTFPTTYLAGSMTPASTTPMHIRAGRVEPANQDKVSDNITSLEIVAGRN